MTMADNTEFEAPVLDEAPVAEAPVAEAPVADDQAAAVVAQSIDEKKNSLNATVPKRWYVIQAFSGFEQRVALTLSERIKLYNMEDDFAEVLVPKEKVKEIKDGKKRETERKFFPGYVLVHMRMTPDTWQLVKHTDRVLGFIGGTSEHPLPITEAEANRILDRLKQSEESPRPKTEFEVGESVRAIDGAFKDFVGTVERVDYEKNRVTVSIAIFGRATPVELEFSQVEKDL